MSDNRRNNLDKALGQFIEAMRSFIIIEMGKVYGDNWDKEYYNGLTDFQKESWEIAINQGKTAKDLIDFHNLRGFALNQRELLRKFFGRDTNNLPTEFSKIAEAYDIDYAKIEREDQLEGELARLIESDQAVIIECIVEKEANVLPMIPAGTSVANLVGERGVLDYE